MPMPSAAASRGLLIAASAPPTRTAPCVGLVVAHDALDQRALAGAVLAEQRVHRARPQLQRDGVERDQRAEALGQATRLQGERLAHDSASSSAREVVTAPKTPFCILTIFSAAAWLPASVAAQQSSSSRHS